MITRAQPSKLPLHMGYTHGIRVLFFGIPGIPHFWTKPGEIHMLLTYCAPHCVGSGFCAGSACLTVVTLSETKSTNYIYIYHHISHIITHIYIYNYIYTQQNQAIVPIATVFDASVAVVAAACAAAVAAAASAAAFAASRSVAAGFASATGWWPPSPKP